MATPSPDPRPTDPAPAGRREILDLSEVAVCVEERQIFGEVSDALLEARPGFVIRDGDRIVGGMSQEHLLAVVNRVGGDLFRYRTMGTLLDVIGRGTAAIIPPDASVEASVRAALARPGPLRLEPLVIACDPPRLLDMGPLLLEHAHRAEQAAQEAEQQRATAVQAGNARTAFLATMSHELRTPLNAILGFVELLHDDALDQRERRRSLGIIQRNGQHLLNLISDMLDLTRLESGEVDLEDAPFNPSLLLSDVVESMFARARTQRCDLHLIVDRDMPHHLRGDLTRLRQVAINIIGNAVKFSEDASVAVRLGPERPPSKDGTVPGTWYLEVADTGIGIDPEKLERIFEPFVQADAGTTRRFGGTGLGLSISRRIVDCMGGTIIASSEPGVGTTFRVHLPRVPAEASTPPTPLPIDDHDRMPDDGAATGPATAASPATEAKPRLGGGAPPRILVVEDGPDNIRLFRTVLKKAGYEVTIAEDGEAGVAQAALARSDGRPFSCILMDRHMPVMDGCEATRRIRAAGDRTPIVAVTASASAQDRADFDAVGADRFLAKPTPPSRLRDTVAEVIEAARADDSASSSRRAA